METHPSKNEIAISYQIVRTKQGRAIVNYDLHCINAIIETLIFLN